MANGSATLDWLSLIDPSNSLIVGTGHDDVLSAQADGDIVLGFAGNDRLNSAFNRTALIGDSGNDTLTTNVVVPLRAIACARTCHSVRRSRQRPPRCDCHAAGREPTSWH